MSAQEPRPLPDSLLLISAIYCDSQRLMANLEVLGFRIESRSADLRRLISRRRFEGIEIDYGCRSFADFEAVSLLTDSFYRYLPTNLRDSIRDLDEWQLEVSTMTHRRSRKKDLDGYRNSIMYVFIIKTGVQSFCDILIERLALVPGSKNFNDRQGPMSVVDETRRCRLSTDYDASTVAIDGVIYKVECVLVRFIQQLVDAGGHRISLSEMREDDQVIRDYPRMDRILKKTCYPRFTLSLNRV